MPKSLSTVQKQISGCERSMQELLDGCFAMFGNTNLQFNFDFNNFVENVTTHDVDNEMANIGKVRQLLTECEKILVIEKKRRRYTEELCKIVADREKRETVKRLKVQNRFKTNFSQDSVAVK